MLPNKLQHGDTLASLMQKYNEMVDYLRQTRLVAGRGIRINRLPTGTTIESTASGGAPPSAPTSKEGHPFDLKIINDGSSEAPVWKVKVFDSQDKYSTIAGVVYAGIYRLYPPVKILSVPDGPTPSYIELVVQYLDNQFVHDIVICLPGQNPYVDNYEQYCTKLIGMITWKNGQPNAVARIKQDIEILGRFV